MDCIIKVRLDKVPHNPVKAVFTIHHLSFRMSDREQRPPVATCWILKSQTNIQLFSSPDFIFFSWGVGRGVTLTSRQPTFTLECLLFDYRQSWGKRFIFFVFPPRLPDASRQAVTSAMVTLPPPGCLRVAHFQRWRALTHTHTPLLGGVIFVLSFWHNCWQKKVPKSPRNHRRLLWYFLKCERNEDKCY